MKTEDWNASHLGQPVRLKGKSSKEHHYLLESLTYQYGSGKIMATLVTIVPSPRPGIIGHYELEGIELVK